MDFKTGRPNHIEDYLASLHNGQWFGWSDSKNKIYSNLIIHDESKDKPTEQECIDGLEELQSNFDNKEQKIIADRSSTKQKLIDLGFNDDEVKLLIGE
tara:strand:+ start:569 stop:862 length:294 start_codon:yes stop_codon:yes gene_type:complete